METTYPSTLNPGILFPILRNKMRQKIGIHKELPFHGVDIWNAYELTWLNLKGKPQIALAALTVPCVSPYLIESKSLKFYLGSFAQHRFSSLEEVRKQMKSDLSRVSGGEVDVQLTLPHEFLDIHYGNFHAATLDEMDIEVDCYSLYPGFLQTEDTIVQESLTSNLFKSNCPVTQQPDFASILIRYRGPKIVREGLLKYLISYRKENEFHEQCTERIFCDLLTRCKPEALTVFAKFTRRGGLDINPFRSNFESADPNIRFPRQ